MIAHYLVRLSFVPVALWLLAFPVHARPQTHVILIYGQGGPTFSLGFSIYGDYLAGQGYLVTKWWPRRPDLVIKYIKSLPKDARIAIISYSLGVNMAVTYIAPAVNRKIDLLVGYDGTVNAPMRSPLSKNVKRGISYWQTCVVCGTGIGFGRATFTGPQVTTYQVWEDHLMVQSDPRLHVITNKALAEIR